LQEARRNLKRVGSINWRKVPPSRRQISRTRGRTVTAMSVVRPMAETQRAKDVAAKLDKNMKNMKAKNFEA
jgi:hypothetical protein